MPVAAAVVGSAVIGAGASMAAASKGAKAQRQAAQMQANSEAQNLALQERIFNQQRADNEPWRQAGMGALSQLVSMSQPGFNTAQIANDPGFQFRKQEGERSLGALLRSTGQTESGAGFKAAMRFGDGLASQEFGNQWNRLAGLAGIGQTANAANQNAGSNFGQAAGSAYGRLGDAYANMGNARASSYAAVGQGINNLASGVGNYFAMKSILGGK